MAVDFSSSELQRYDRQLLMPGWGMEGQMKLKLAKVVIAGVGGLGCPAAIYLAAAGVGKLLIIDRDKYELSNLNRQVLGWHKDLQCFKAEAAKEKLEALNPDINVEALVADITEDTISDLVRGANVVVDALDNWKTRFIINKECVKEKIPFVHAGVYGLTGQITTIIPGRGPCLRCIIPNEPNEIHRFPVVGATPALLAMIQVMETLKLIIGIGEPLTGKILTLDGEHMSFDTIKVQRNPNCLICKNS